MTAIMFSDKLMLTVYVLVLSDTLTLNFVFLTGRSVTVTLNLTLTVTLALTLRENSVVFMTHPSYIPHDSNNNPLTLS